MTPTFIDHKRSPVLLGVPGKEHVELFLGLQNNPESRQYLGRYMPITENAEEEWVAKRAHTSTDAAFVIIEKETSTPIGSMGLHGIQLKDRRATTGAAILEKYCDKGYGTAAKMLLLSWAFLDLGLHKVESRTIAFNKRSQAYSSKCGYKQVGCLKEHHFRKGKWHDEIILEVHAKHWLSLWKKFCKD